MRQKTGSGAGIVSGRQPASAAVRPGATPALAPFSSHIPMKSLCHLKSAVISGWKAVPSNWPWRTATTTRSVAATPVGDAAAMSASTSTEEPHDMMAGARMNTARKVSPLHVPRKRGCQRILAITVCATMTHSAMERKHGGAGNCVSKLSTWLPK